MSDILQIAKIIAWAVEASFNLGEGVFNVTRGNNKMAFARHIVFYLLHCGCGYSLNRIAHTLNRERATVSYGIKKIEDMRDDKKLDEYLDAMVDKCQILIKIREIKYDYSA